MPASTPRVRKSTAAAMAAVAGLALVGTFAIDSSGAADAATTTATAASTRTATAVPASTLARIQRVSADAVGSTAAAKPAAAKPANAVTLAQLADTPAGAARAAAVKQAAEVKAAAARKAAALKQAAEAKQAAAAKHAAEVKQAAAAKKAAARQSAPSAPSGSPQQIAAQIVPGGQLASFDEIISHESGWNVEAVNPSSGSYGLGQALPADKMASAGSDWRTNPATQITWALDYMDSRYGSPNQAWSFWQANSWY